MQLGICCLDLSHPGQLHLAGSELRVDQLICHASGWAIVTVGMQQRRAVKSLTLPQQQKSSVAASGQMQAFLLADAKYFISETLSAAELNHLLCSSLIGTCVAPQGCDRALSGQQHGRSQQLQVDTVWGR